MALHRCPALPGHSGQSPAATADRRQDGVHSRRLEGAVPVGRGPHLTAIGVGGRQ